MKLKKMNKTYILLCLLCLISCGKEKVTDAVELNTYPYIYPDYIGVTVPVNIAPLNFDLLNDYQKIDIRIAGDNNEIHIQESSCIDIPLDDWHKLLSENIGDSLMIKVSIKNQNGWNSFEPFPIYISSDSIDYGLTYRLISPGYEVYNDMGIYQRELSNFNQSGILENSQVDGCINCHSYRQGDPTFFSLHVRGPHGATLIRNDRLMDAYNTKTDSTLAACVYPYWHPSGRYIAYSTNDTRQIVHAAGNKCVEVFDLASDVQVFDVETNELIVPKILQQDSIWETFPAFSSDGKKLYFCAAKAGDMSKDIKNIRYDLCSIGFDPTTGTFDNEIDTIVKASTIGKSVSFPRPSYDGKFVIYTLSDYGNFSIWHSEADLWILDLSDLSTRPLDEINSNDTESYHSWSSNSRWLAFSSRRDDGLYTRSYICHIDSLGNTSKPFILPQRHPIEYYSRLYKSFNIPEFVTAPVNLDRIYAEELLLSPSRKQMKVRKDRS